jgi:hypothetical protein
MVATGPRNRKKSYAVKKTEQQPPKISKNQTRMKKTILAALALAGLAAMNNAGATPSYNFGDSLLLFRIDQTASSSTTGYNLNVAIDLGNLNFLPSNFSYNLSGSSLTSLLDATYGSGWANNANLWAGVIGTTTDSVTTSYVTTDSPAFGRTTWSYINSYNGQMATAFKNSGIITSVTDNNGTAHWASVLDITSGLGYANNFTLMDDPSLATTTTGFGQNFAGPIGTYLSAADTNSTVDFTITTYTKGAVNDHANGDVSIDSTGAITVNAVPEPSMYALIGLGALLLIIAARRGSNA